MKQLNKILFWASGARTSLLDKITEFEKRKFQLIGASLLISAFVSTLSAFYAISLISQNTISSLLIGLMWGILVTNLNRLLISSIIDNQNDKQRKFIWFLLSFILSCFIGLTIAFPLQLKVFETEINSNIVTKKINDIELIERVYEIEIEEHYNNLKKYEDQLTKETFGSGSGKQGNESIKNQIKSKIVEQENSIETLRFEKSKLRENIFSSQSTFIEKTNSLNEIIQQNNTMRYICYLLFLSFLLVELLPITIAYTSKSSLYEEFVEKIESSNFDFEKKQTNEQISLTNNPINTFETFCVSSIIDINHNIDNLKGKANEQLRSGLLVSLIGILAYLGYGTFLFIVYFETHEFQNHHIFLFSSLSIIFFFMQFLAGWYLKQYRTTMDYANSLTINKELYNKYILAKIATTNLPNNETNKLIETKLLFDILGDGKISETLITGQSDNNNFAKEVFDSINSLKDLINNFGKAGK